MLKDRSQLLNKLQNSNITCKSVAFGQNIKNPYLVQLKIFQQRLKNPKLKCRSVIMRKKLIDIDINKQNFNKQIKKFHQQDCIKQVKKILKKQNQTFSILHFRTIGDDIQQKQKQQQVVTKFKMKINDIKLIKMISNNLQNQQNNSFHYLKLSSNKNLSQTNSAVDSSRPSVISNVPTDIIQRKKYNFDIKTFKIKDNKKDKLPLSFINYKKSKSLVERFTKDNK